MKELKKMDHHNLRNKFKMGRASLSAIILFSLHLSSCNFTQVESKINSESVVNINDGTLNYKAYVYRDSPHAVLGPKYDPSNIKIERAVDQVYPAFITYESTLQADCSINLTTNLGPPEEQNLSTVDNCIIVKANKEQSTLLGRPENGTWIFETGSPEFYQVNTLFHLNQGLKNFYDRLAWAHRKVGMINAGPELCFGYVPEYQNFYIAQDPSVIQHELGHAFVSVLMNLRNIDVATSSSHPYRSNLGNFGYDEAGSINEGIADYFSFMINKRTHFGEWALGKVARQSRPLSENDPIHIDALSTTSEGRLSYPNYLLYDPNLPESPAEDIHYAGQITSHYLVALTREFQKQCTYSDNKKISLDTAINYVFLLLAETLSEVGDLNLKPGPYLNNMDHTNSFLWAHIINPPSYRRFFQVFAKKINTYISYEDNPRGGLCPEFDRNESEKLLDDYGLLLFKNYNDNRNRANDTAKLDDDDVTAPSSETVSEDNRRKSVLINKEFIRLDERTNERPNATNFFVIDNRSDVEALMQNLLFKGVALPLTNDVSSVDYNNGNIKISPGEIVAVIPNLYNASNATIAGAQILATDWDHMIDVVDETEGYIKPCLLDGMTTVNDGAVACPTNLTYPIKNYTRLKLQDPPTDIFPNAAVEPVCMVLLNDTNGGASKWVSQYEFYKKHLAGEVEDSECLGYNANTNNDPDFTFIPHECLVRFLPGANEGSYSKIYPQNDYFTSVVKDSESKSFNTGNILIMEVNKWIPPGTQFRCRLRARFSNCSNCFSDYAENATLKDDFLDSDFNGAKPFKIINFDFTVND